MGVAKDIELPSLPEQINESVKNIISVDEFSRKKLKMILHLITGELKTRGTKTPHIFLPYRSKIDDRRLERFLGHFFPYGELIDMQNKERVASILKNTDEFTLMCGLKYLWSRLPNGEVIGWDVYLEYKRKEREAGYPRSAFLSIMPKCLSSPAHASIVYDFLDLLVNIASNSQYNFLSGRKIAKLASLWAFNVSARREHSPFFDATRSNENTFLDGLDAWKSSSGALFHLFLSFLRAMLPDSEMEKLRLPKTLQSLLMSNSYPPAENTDSIKTMITIPCVIIRSTRPSSNPYELLSKVRHTLSFDKKDAFLSIENYTILKNIFQKESTNEIVSTLTEESRRILSTLTSPTVDSEYGVFPGWARGGPEVDPDIPLYSQASIHDVTLQDYYIWTWLSSIGSDQSNSMKKLFGRSLVVEAGLRGFQKWLVVTEKSISPDEYIRLFKTTDISRETKDTRVLSNETYKNMPLPAPPPVPPSKDEKEILPKLRFEEDNYKIDLGVEAQDQENVHMNHSDGDNESFIYPSKSKNNDFNEYITSLNDFDEDKLVQDFNMKSMISVDSGNASKHSGNRPPPPPLESHILNTNEGHTTSRHASPSVPQLESSFQNPYYGNVKQSYEQSFKEPFEDYETEYDRRESEKTRKPSEPFDDYYIPGIDKKHPSMSGGIPLPKEQSQHNVQHDEQYASSPEKQSQIYEQNVSSSPKIHTVYQNQVPNTNENMESKSQEELIKEERRRKKKKEKRRREKEAAAAMYGGYNSYNYLPPGPPPPHPPPPGLAPPFVTSPTGENVPLPPGFFPMGHPGGFETSPKKQKKKKKKHGGAGESTNDNDKDKANLIDSTHLPSNSNISQPPFANNDEGMEKVKSKIPKHLLPKIVLDSNSISSKDKIDQSSGKNVNQHSPSSFESQSPINGGKENLPPLPYENSSMKVPHPTAKPNRKSPSGNDEVKHSDQSTRSESAQALPLMTPQGSTSYPNTQQTTDASPHQPHSQRFRPQPIMQDISQPAVQLQQQSLSNHSPQTQTQRLQHQDVKPGNPKSQNNVPAQAHQSNGSSHSLPKQGTASTAYSQQNQSPSYAQSHVQQPYVQQPYVQQPYVQQPHMQQPHMQKPHVQQHHVQQPHLQQPHVQQPHIQQPHIQQPHVQQPHIQQPHIQQPHVQQPHSQPFVQQGHPSQFQQPTHQYQQQFPPQDFNQYAQQNVSPQATQLSPQTYPQQISPSYAPNMPPAQHSQYQYQPPMPSGTYVQNQSQQPYLPVPQQGAVNPNVQIVYQTVPATHPPNAPVKSTSVNTSDVTMLNMPSASKFNKNNKNKKDLRAALNHGFGI